LTPISAAKLLTRVDAARRIAANIANLPGLQTLFADVMTTEEVTGFLDRAAALKQAAE
jgi:hypothetical protein